MASSLRFQSVAWLLLEPKSTFYSPCYRQESLTVRRQVLPFWSDPQTVLHLGQTEFLVLQSSPQDTSKRSGDPKETKKLLQLTVRPLDDVRRAQLYQTAARTQVLELFVDGEHTRERLLRWLRGQEEREEAEPGKKLLDDAFVALERAQESWDRETALELYKEAERGFYEAEQVLPDDRSRELLRVRREDLQKTIQALDREVKVGGGDKNRPEPDLVALPTTPKAEAEVWTAPPAVDITARLEELRRFAAEQDTARIKQESKTDLAARLAALKNEKAGPAPPVDDLAERLRRLRGDNGSSEAAPGLEKNVEGKSAVDRIVEQVADEIALGIEDDDVDFDEELDSDSVSSSQSKDSETSKSSNEDDSHKK